MSRFSVVKIGFFVEFRKIMNVGRLGTPRGDPREKMTNVSMGPARGPDSASNDTSFDSIRPLIKNLFKKNAFSRVPFD